MQRAGTDLTMCFFLMVRLKMQIFCLVEISPAIEGRLQQLFSWVEGRMSLFRVISSLYVTGEASVGLIVVTH